MSSLLRWAINQVALIQSLGIGVCFLKAMQDVAEIGSGQFSVGFPFEAGAATIVNGVVHEHSRANALWLISRARRNLSSKSLKEV
jgi:hypothetical protein